MDSKAEIWNKICWYKQIVTECNEKIERLEKVYKSLGSAKDEFESARKNTKTVFQGGTWRGSKYTAFCEAGDELDGTLGAYYQQLDAAQDAINTEIGNLKVKRDSQLPIIGELVAAYDKVETVVENAFN